MITKRHNLIVFSIRSNRIMSLLQPNCTPPCTNTHTAIEIARRVAQEAPPGMLVCYSN